MEKKNLKAWLYLLPAMAFLGVFMVYPLIDVFIYSFEEGYNSASQTYFGVGLYNYKYVLHDPYFLQALKNTFILVIFTVPISTGIALLAVSAAELAARGDMTAEQIRDEMLVRREKLDVSFTLDTLKYLSKGGRCSAVAALGANVLGLKPCIEVKDGKKGVRKKYRGAFEKCLKEYITDRLSDRDDLELDREQETIENTLDGMDAAEDLLERIERSNGVTTLFVEGFDSDRIMM